MTDNPKHEFADRQPGIPNLTEREAHLIAEDMRAAGLSSEAVNDHLKALGHAPLDASPAAEASRTLTALKNDPVWLAKFHAGDADAERRFSELTLAISQGGTAEKKLRPDEYSLTPMADASDKDAETWNTEYRAFAASLGLTQMEARQIAQIHLDGVARWSRMSADEQENFGHQQTAMLHGVLAKTGDAEAQIKAATETLKRASGKDVDVARICRQVGAEQALELVIAAQRIARRP